MDVIERRAPEGFQLEERVVSDAWVWGWSRDGDDRWPCSLTERETLSWMDDRLQRIGVFD